MASYPGRCKSSSASLRAPNLAKTVNSVTYDNYWYYMKNILSPGANTTEYTYPMYIYNLHIKNSTQ
jgi:hypothetical protein